MTPQTDALSALQRRVDAHEILLRTLLTHLAMSDPDGFRAIVAGFARSRSLHGDAAGQAAAEELADIVEDVARSLNRY